MKKTNLIVISVLAAVLLSRAFISLAAAADDEVPDASAIPDPSQTAPSDNSTMTQCNCVLYTVKENSTASDDTMVPGYILTEENPNLIATQTISGNNIPLVAIAAVLSFVLGAIGVFFYRKKAAKA